MSQDWAKSLEKSNQLLKQKAHKFLKVTLKQKQTQWVMIYLVTIQLIKFNNSHSKHRISKIKLNNKHFLKVK
jgi:hypothetical protein